MNSGNLGPEWGYDTADSKESTPAVVQYYREDVPHSLDSLVTDSALMHSVCIGEFRKFSNTDQMLETYAQLLLALNGICARCALDGFTEDEVAELWYAPMIFSEFYILSDELFKSLHRSMTLNDAILQFPLDLGETNSS